jgi:hypothetical protein
MTSPVSPRKWHPHPARRSRRVAGALSVGATLALAGGMAAGAHTVTKTSTSVTTTPSSSSSSGSSYGSSDDNGYDDGSSAWSQFNVPARSGNTSSNPDTSSHAS